MTSENTAPVSERGEWTAWLIERDGQWYAAAPHSRWTTQQAIDANTWRENWTTDANEALRFARKCDAETLIRYEGFQNAVATEHVWLEREEWPDLRDPRNIRRALRQAQDNLERAAASPAPPPPSDVVEEGSCMRSASDVVKGEEAPSGPQAIDPEGPISQAELVGMFGSDMPVEAVNLLWSAEDGATIGDVRKRLREMAAKPSTTNLSSSPHEQNTPSTPPDTPEGVSEAEAAMKEIFAKHGPALREALRPFQTLPAIGDEVVEAIRQMILVEEAEQTRLRSMPSAYSWNKVAVVDGKLDVLRKLSALHQAGKLPAETDMALLRRLVDLTYGFAMEDQSVPSTKVALALIEQAQDDVRDGPKDGLTMKDRLHMRGVNYTPPNQTDSNGEGSVTPLKCPGVGRDAANLSALAFYFSRRVTDAEMRFLHEVVQRAVALMPDDLEPQERRP